MSGWLFTDLLEINPELTAADFITVDSYPSFLVSPIGQISLKRSDPLELGVPFGGIMIGFRYLQGPGFGVPDPQWTVLAGLQKQNSLFTHIYRTIVVFVRQSGGNVNIEVGVKDLASNTENIFFSSINGVVYPFNPYSNFAGRVFEGQVLTGLTQGSPFYISYQWEDQFENININVYAGTNPASLTLACVA